MDVESIFDRFYAPLYRYLLRLCGDAEMAADAAQEAFVRLAERPPAHQGNLQAWLYTVGGNAVRDTLKLRRRRLELLRAAPQRTPLSDQPDRPDVHAERLERRGLVRAALGQLRPRERTVLLMRAEGFSYRDIAKAADVSPNSVGVIAARALRKLSSLLEPDKAGLS